ncbi:MAG: hypothetical protein IRY91_13860 [Gemmatimonadaceae bacterium]|nr:hypothetical protein [Gemmatimonadaceae bacterium]
MRDLDQSSYAFQQFYSRNTHFAPAPRARMRWRRVVVYASLLLAGSTAATGAYVLSTGAARNGLARIGTPHALWTSAVKLVRSAVDR